MKQNCFTNMNDDIKNFIKGAGFLMDITLTHELEIIHSLYKKPQKVTINSIDYTTLSSAWSTVGEKLQEEFQTCRKEICHVRNSNQEKHPKS